MSDKKTDNIELAEPDISPKKGISPVWILPIIALLLGSWLLVKGILDKGIMITLKVPTSEGIEVGKTNVMYKGIAVGVVKEREAAEDLQHIILSIEMDKKAEDFLTDKTLFWIVEPRITLAGVSGLETILGGRYINARPDNTGKPKFDFVALNEPPPPLITTPGLHIKLRLNRLASIDKGTKIYYKQIPVGKVTNYKLAENDTEIHARVIIQPEYAHLVKKESRFYNVSGIKVDASLTGIKVQTESLISVIAGGISFYTPREIEKPHPAELNAVYLLYDDFDSAKVGLTLILRTLDVSKMRQGFTKLRYQGMTIGLLKHIRYEKHTDNALLIFSINPDTETILREDSQFWLVSPKVSLLQISGLDALIQGDYVSVRPGRGEFSNHFQLLDSKPPLPASAPGLHIKLTANTLGSVKVETPVYFRQLQVGQVQGYNLDEDDETIVFKVFIQPQYAHLVKKNSRFYNVSGFTIKGDLSGIKVKTESLTTILSGGIAFDTPLNKEAQPASTNNGDSFPLYEDFEDARAGVSIKLEFDTAEGLNAGGTKIIYKGVELGHVKTIDINKEKRVAIATVILDPIADNILTEGTKFWMVKPKISLSGIENIGTLISGNYITFRIGKGKRKTSFKMLNSAPRLDLGSPGLHLKVKTVDLGSIDVGSPVLYQRIVIGNVRDYELAKDKKNVLIYLHIWPEYQSLVSNNSRFYNASGINIKANLAGINVRTESLQAILKGGIALYNTDSKKTAPKAKNAAVFDLFDDFEAAKMNAFYIRIQFDSSRDLLEGSKIIYQGISVGKVKEITLGKESRKIMVLAQLDGKLRKILGKNSRFWIVEPTLGLVRAKNLGALVTGNYLRLIPEKGQLTDFFIGLEARPLIDHSQNTYNVNLTAARLGSVRTGDPVYYRQVKVGDVIGYELADTSDQILIYLSIAKRYQPLIRENSRFWHASGINVDFNLFSGTSIRTESLESILAGGITFATPDNELMGKELPDNSYFVLHDEADANWLEWNPIIHLGRETLQH